MTVAFTRPFEATAAAVALSAKDALRLARHGLRHVRSDVLPPMNSLPHPVQRLVLGLDHVSHAPARVLKTGLAVLPFAPRPLSMPCGFSELDARRARDGELASRLAIGDAVHDAFETLLARQGLDLMIFEAALAEVVMDALDRSRGGTPAFRAAALAAALVESEGRIVGVGSAHRDAWCRAALALALATVVAEEQGAASGEDTLAAAVDLVVALGEETDAAVRDRARLEAFVARYVPHV